LKLKTEILGLFEEGKAIQNLEEGKEGIVILKENSFLC